jgi:cell wall-associated protease
LKSHLNVEKLTRESINTVKPTTETLSRSKQMMLYFYDQVGHDADLDDVLSELKEANNHFEVQVKYGYNPEFDSREIVGDNYKNQKEKGYGNNDVIGPDASHGTHVAGIIAADRNNDLGIRGIANNVLIMVVRAVPNGDERDKDIANAIRYAVDNGAHIINMSFGKSFSGNKAIVDEAVRYAVQKGVLLIHAAGNDSKDVDVEKNYPNPMLTATERAATWIEVGASGWGADEAFVGDFSNFGKNSVDVFAPGVDVNSLQPDNKYKNNSGTSMAAPSTSGVAAILMSYYPNLSAVQVRDILLNSARRFDGLKVKKPGAEDLIEFSQLSRTGGLVNAWEALQLAEEMSKGATSVR